MPLKPDLPLTLLSQLPSLAAWEAERQVPRSLYREAGRAGLLGVAMPEEFGGVGGGDPWTPSPCRPLQLAPDPTYLDAPARRAVIGILTLIDFCDEVSRAGALMLACRSIETIAAGRVKGEAPLQGACVAAPRR